MTSHRRGAVVIVGCVLGLIFLLLAIRGTNIDEVWGVLSGTDIPLAVLFLVTVALLYWIRALRWSALLRPVDSAATAKTLFPAVMIGFSSGVVLPPPLSDFVRMFVAGERLKLSKASVMTSIVLERVFDFLFIVLFFGIALIWAPKATRQFVAIGYLGGVLALAVLLVGMAYVTWTERLQSVLFRLFSFLPERLERIFVAQTEFAASGLLALKSKRSVYMVSLLTCAQWGLMAIGIHICIVAVGLSVHLSAGFVVLVLTFVGLTLPTTPGAVGTIQLAFVLGLRQYAVGSGDAVAASVVWQGIAYSFVMLCGLFFVIRGGYTVDEIRRRGKHESEESGY